MWADCGSLIGVCAFQCDQSSRSTPVRRPAITHGGQNIFFGKITLFLFAGCGELNKDILM